MNNFFRSVIISYIVGFSVMAADVPTILALGDSITEGGKNFVSYRQELVLQLQQKKVLFKFIGPKKDHSSAHAGYSGKNTKSISKMSTKIYQKYPADIVLIHSGHNSFSKNKPVPGIVRDTEAIIQNIRKLNPKVKILLAQVIPAGKLPKYSYIPELNKELGSLAKRISTDDNNVAIVNLAEGFDWKSDTTKDKVHPNASGAKKMANKWLLALLPILGKN